MSLYKGDSKVMGEISVVNEENMRNIAKEEAMEVYSTEEQVVGTWIDGKPIYRKVIYIEEVGSGTTSVTDISPLKCDHIVRIYGTGRYASKTGLQVTIPYNYDNGYSFSTYTSGDASMLYIRSKTSPTYHIYAIIEYTKTTDA